MYKAKPATSSVPGSRLERLAHLGYWHTPPVDAVFLRRKIGGLYLLATRLRAKIDVRAILEPHLSR
jgi:hypothetical protein